MAHRERIFRMKIIDEKGRLNIFGWCINIIDFLVLIFILCLMPGFWFGYRIFTKPPPPIAIVEPPHFYTITRTCSNCGKAVSIDIPIGMAICDMWYAEESCPNCGFEFAWVDTGGGIHK